MLNPSRKPIWPTAAASTAALSTLLAAAAFVQVGDGIAYSPGAGLELGLCGVSLLALFAIARGWPRSPIRRALRAIVLTLCLAGAVVAAYFLNAWALLGAVSLTTLLWLAALIAGIGGRHD